MIDTDLSELAQRAPDRVLEGLESRIWSGVAERQAMLRVRRRLLALQCVVVAAALIGSLIAGRYRYAAQLGGSLDVFSPRMPLSAATLLTDNAP